MAQAASGNSEPSGDGRSIMMSLGPVPPMTLPKPYYSEAGITIFHADCTQIMQFLEPSSIDLVLTDPPYAAATATATTGFAREKWGGNWGDMSMVQMLARLVIGRPFLTNEHQIYWFCDPFSFAALIPEFFRQYHLVQSIVWDKDMLGVGAHYRKQTEFVIYARTNGAPTVSTSCRDIVRLRPMYAEKEHPSAKPVELIKHFAEASTWTTVLDPFMGSGTTLRAAKDLGRKAIGIEIEERYCEIAVKRLAQEVLPL